MCLEYSSQTTIRTLDGRNRRRQQLAAKLMQCLEDITTRVHDGYFVDLFVRASNKTAIKMYTQVTETS